MNRNPLTPARSGRFPMRLGPIVRRFGPATFLLSCMLTGCTGLAKPTESATEAKVGVDVLGKYVWRGILVSDVTVAQPSIDITNGGFGANVWGNFDLEEQDTTDNERQFNELDLTLRYSRDVGPVSLSAGVIHYVFPNNGLPSPGTVPGSTLKDGDTTEVYVGGSLGDVLLAPSLTGYFDLDETNGGAYFNLGASHSFGLEFLEQPSLAAVAVTAGLGWATSDFNDFYFGAPVGSGLVDFKASVGVPIDLGAKGDSGWVLTPSVTWTQLLDSDLRDAHGDDDSNLIWGVSFAVAF